MGYAIRLPANRVLQEKIGHSSARSVDRRMKSRCRGRCSKKFCRSSPGCGRRPRQHEGRWDRMPQTTTAGVRLREGKETSFRLRGGQLDDFAAHGIVCDLISLRRHPGETQNYPNGPGIRGMSVKTS
jgi:hypothetical protein